MKRYLWYGIIASIVFSIQGCSLWQQPQAPEITTQQATPPPANEMPLTRLVGKNYIKGIVMALKHDTKNNLWHYTIEGVDTSNGKLPYVAFNHKSVVANEGDLVYATFDGMKMTEMLIIKAGYFKNGKRQDVVPTKKATAKTPAKRDKAHQVLSVPQEEFIRLQ